MTKTLYMVDPLLRRFGGHQFVDDQSICEAAINAGYECTILASHDVDPQIAQILPVKGVFHEHHHISWPYESWLRIPRFGKLLDKLFINLLFCWRLLHAFGRSKLTPDDIVLIPNTTARILYGCAWWYRTIPRRRRPRFILQVHIGSWPHFEYRGTYSALQLLEKTPGGQVSLCTHSERLMREFARFSRLPVRVVPIPLETFQPNSTELSIADIDPTRRCFVYLGEARDEKGLVEILLAIQQLARLGELDSFTFVIQASRASNKPQERCYALIEQIEQQRLPNVFFFHQVLQSGEYQALFQRADVILVPYLCSEYVSRVSRVFAEALAAGKPVIATANTWMSEQLDNYGAGVICNDQDPLDLVRAIRWIDSGFADFAARAKSRAAAWRAIHNLSAMFEALLTPIAPPMRPSKIALIYPLEGVILGKSGNAQRARQLIDYLGIRFDHVRVISPGNEGDFADDNVRFFFLRQSRFQQWLTNRVWERLYRCYQWLITLGENKQEDSAMWPLWEFYRYPLDPKLKRILTQTARWADAIILEYPFWTRQLAPICERENVRLIVTAHDILANMLTHSFTLHDIAFKLELDGYRAADQVVVVSAGDQQILQKYEVPSVVIEHGLNATAYDALAVTPEAARKLLKEGFKLTLPAGRICLFVGSYNYPNLQAVPEIRQFAQLLRPPFIAKPINFVIAGKCCDPQIADNFVALGDVSEEALYLLYKVADLVVIPLQKGTGASVKTVQALLYGKAVLGTPIGFRGYLVTSGVNAFICEQVSDFPMSIIRLLRDPSNLRAVGQKARIFARRYEYQRIYMGYEQLILNGPPDLSTALPAQPMANLLNVAMRKYPITGGATKERRLGEQKLKLLAERVHDKRSHILTQDPETPSPFSATVEYPPSVE